MLNDPKGVAAESLAAAPVAVTTTSTSADIAMRYPIPASFETDARWTKTDIPHDGNFSGGAWYVNERDELAFKKPGLARPTGSLEAFREAVCSVIATWLDVNVPEIKLWTCPTAGPSSLSLALGPTVRKYAELLAGKRFADIRERALVALEQHVGQMLVFDALVHAEDRNNHTNYLFVEETCTWHSIDYGLSFASKLVPYGIGDPQTPYEYRYMDDIRERLRVARRPIRVAREVAGNIPDEAIDRLVGLPPASFASDRERAEAAAFLKDRRSRIEEILDTWGKATGLSGVL